MKEYMGVDFIVKHIRECMAVMGFSKRLKLEVMRSEEMKWHVGRRSFSYLKRQRGVK